MYILKYILSNWFGHFGEGSVFCEYLVCDYILIIDYLHILFHGTFVESEDVKKRTTSSHSDFVSIIVVIYSSKSISILFLSIHSAVYKVHNIQFTYLIFSLELLTLILP